MDNFSRTEKPRHISDKLLDRLRQLRQIYRLGQVANSAFVERLLDRSYCGIRGHHDGLEFRRALNQLFQQGDTIYGPKLDIEQSDLKGVAGKQTQRLLSARCGDDIVAALGEKPMEKREKVLFIIDYKD